MFDHWKEFSVTQVSTQSSETVGIAASRGRIPLPGGALKASPRQIQTVDRGALTSMGRRVTRVIGATVVDDGGEMLGRVGDLISTPDGEGLFAELSVGGFLGMGAKHVAVRYDALEARYRLMLLRGATRDSLKVLPDVSLTVGDRASKVIAAAVVNEAGEMLGRVDDLIVTRGQNRLFAVLSVGTFRGKRGGRTKCVVVPYRALERHEGYLLFAGATKEVLKDLPEFKYEMA